MFKIVPCTWGEDLQQRIYRDYGWHCKKQRYFKNAIQQFQKSAEIEKDEMLLQKRGYTHYENIEIEEALADARESLDLRSSNYKMAKLQNNCVIAQNRFEEEIKLISNQVAKFDGLKKKFLNTYLTTRNENYLNIIGPPSGPCLLKLQNAFHRIPPKPVAPDITPKWKLLKNAGICDCESIVAFGGKTPSLLDRVKQRKGYRVFTQQYMGPSSHDLEYLQMLCDNSTLFSAPLPHPDLQADIRKDYAKAWRVVKMLHANMPVYSLYQAQFGTAERMQEYRKKYILRLQYLARREVFNLLQTIREVATRNDHEALLNLVDKVVGLTLPLKTHAILPRKNDFINEISNIIALFYINRLTYPGIDSSEIEVEDCKAILYKMLDIEREKEKGIPPEMIFGDKSTYVDPDEPDYAFLAYKKRVVVYEKRAADTKYFMEKCFLLHEAARSHLDSGNFDDAKNFADRVLNEAAKSCDSIIWSYLALLVLCRSDVITSNIMRGRDNFLMLVKLSKTLKSPFLIKVSTYASELNKKLCDHQAAHSVSLPLLLPPAK